MKPSRFDLVRPRTLDEALDLLSTLGDACIIAGGQSLVPMMNLRIAAPSTLIDINGIGELKGIRIDGDRLRIGAATRQQHILESDLVVRHAPLLAAAFEHIGHYATRCRGTLGGSLANADLSAESSLVCCTLRAELKIARAGQVRTVSAADFIVDVMATVLKPGEILVEIAFPIAPAGTKIAFKEYARHHGHFATASAAVQLSPDGPTLLAGLGAISAMPVICSQIESAFNSARGLADLDELIARQLSAVDIVSDIHTDETYRRQLAAVCLADCLRDVMAQREN